MVRSNLKQQFAVVLVPPPTMADVATTGQLEWVCQCAARHLDRWVLLDPLALLGERIRRRCICKVVVPSNVLYGLTCSTAINGVM